MSTGLGGLAGTSYGGMNSVAGGTIATQAANASNAAKYITAQEGSGEGSVHTGCLPGIAPFAVTWIPAHKECAGIVGLVIPITPYNTTLQGAAEITNANFEMKGNGATVPTMVALNGFVDSGIG